MPRNFKMRGITGATKGHVWESAELLRVGRLPGLEVVLDDASVSRFHAEVRWTERGWRVHDLGSTNGTRLNGNRLGSGHWPVKVRDLIQFGEVAVVVELADQGLPGSPTEDEQLRVEMTSQLSWDEALQGLAFDVNRCPRPGEQLMALLRASHHLGRLENEDELLRSILEDAVQALDAQRGTIALAEGPRNALRLRALSTGRSQPRQAMGGAEPASRHGFSQSLAQRCFGRGESVLCQTVADDPELAMARSIAEGAMASVICVPLRTPRRRLGVLHLDRGPWQKPFNGDDLHLADALAASVSAGIESAQLLRKQRDLFLSTISVLADVVELRDAYTGGHTMRVTRFSLLLAQQLGLPPTEIELIRLGTPLHDIGKIGIDDAILRKPGRLTPAEFEVMKQHTVKGAEILQGIPELHPVIPIARSHHERWDGQGYPDGLEGEVTPRLARIVAVADAFDAMTSDRPYRKGMPAAAAFAEVEKMSGRQFDPACAAAFLAIREQIEQEMRGSETTAVLGKRQMKRQTNSPVPAPEGDEEDVALARGQGW